MAMTRYGDDGSAVMAATDLTAGTLPGIQGLAAYFGIAVAAGVAVWWLTRQLEGKGKRGSYSGPRIVHSHFVESDGDPEDDESESERADEEEDEEEEEDDEGEEDEQEEDDHEED